MPRVAENPTRARIALNNILYLTDFSPPSVAALPYAKSVAMEFGAKLHALHVLAPDGYAATTPELAFEVEEGQKQYAKAQMKKIDASLRDMAHVTRIESGAFWPGLEHVVKTSHIDMIVVGTHGRTGVRKMLLGSVAEEVFRGSNVPVLTVGPGVSSKPATQLRCILYGTDFSRASLAAVPYAFSLAEETQARLVLLHVIRQLRKEEMLGELSIADALHQLHELVPADSMLWCRPDPTVVYGDPAEKIVEFAAEQAADVIVLGIRHGDHASVTAHLSQTTAHKVVSRATCPVLTVRG